MFSKLTTTKIIFPSKNAFFKRMLHSELFRQFLALTGAKRIHCIGDSHVKMFQYVADHHLWLRTQFHFCMVQGGTAMGMVNPNSKTQALNKFKDYLQIVSNNDKLLFCLGEVDCGFVIWYRSKKYGLSVDDQFNHSIQSYCQFLNWVEDEGFKDIIVASVPLPTILHGQEWGEVAKARREVQSTLQQRTDLTIRYNEYLRNYCLKRRWSFLDYEQDILDPKKRTVLPYFRHPNPLDHHLNEIRISPILNQKLREIGFR